jgi:Family of unknown function (DUF6317)
LEAADVSDGYQVVLGDVLSMAQTFGSESRTLAGAVSAAGVSAPDGGDGTINGALSNALKSAGLATGQLAAVVESHSQKLSSAYTQYRGAEQSSTQLCQELTSLITGS